jgi:hypothetical protein
MNQPTVLALAMELPGFDYAPAFFEVDGRTLLERQLRQLRELGCERFAVVCPPEQQGLVEALGRDLSARVWVAVQPRPLGEGDALVQAEPVLSHLAATHVYVTQPHIVTGDDLHRLMLEAWAERPSAVEGLVAAGRGSGEQWRARLRLQGERLVWVEPAAGRRSRRSDLIELGVLVYASSRELCETAGDEADNQGAEHPYESALSRLMAWYEFRPVWYEGSFVEWREAAGPALPLDP